MKIYFNAAVSARSQHGEAYAKIVTILEKLDHDVFAGHILNKNLGEITRQTQADTEAYYKKMLQDLKNADLMVAEVSFPSTVHVGHELTLALDAGKPVLALYKKEYKPVLFWGITSDKFFVAEYEDSNLGEVINKALDYLAKTVDTRFNFFISPHISNYLDWVAKKKRTPRAVYLRKLIEKAMETEKFEQ